MNNHHGINIHHTSHSQENLAKNQTTPFLQTNHQDWTKTQEAGKTGTLIRACLYYAHAVDCTILPDSKERILRT